jgi:hypothetical protein
MRHTSRRLAESEIACVEHCAECQTVHVHLGNTSLRFRSTTFLELCETLYTAVRRLDPTLDGALRLMVRPNRLGH